MLHLLNTPWASLVILCLWSMIWTGWLEGTFTESASGSLHEVDGGLVSFLSLDQRCLALFVRRGVLRHMLQILWGPPRIDSIRWITSLFPYAMFVGGSKWQAKTQDTSTSDSRSVRPWTSSLIFDWQACHHEAYEEFQLPIIAHVSSQFLA